MNLRFIDRSAKIHLALFLIVIASIGVFAQDKKPDVTAPETPKEKKFEKVHAKRIYSPSQFFHETSLFVKQPTKWKRRDWLRVGAVIATTIAVMPLDESITNSTQGEQRYFHSAFVEGGRIYGEWYSIGSVAGAFA